MKPTFGWLCLTTATLLIGLESVSFAADHQPIQRTDSVPSIDLVAQRRLERRLDRAQQGFRVPIHGRVAGIPVIPVTLGNRTFPILVDTGATVTTITPEMAKAAGFRREGMVKVTLGNGDVVEMPKGRISSIAIVDTVINKFKVIVGSTPLLGQNFFGGYNVTIGQNAVVFRERRR